MGGTLKYPWNPAAPTIALQLIIDTALAKPTVAESATIGFPFELTQIIFSVSDAVANVYQLSLMAALNPYTSGDPFNEPHLIQLRGDTLNNNPTVLPFNATAELLLRPRIRVPVSGRRLRLVENGAIFGNALRALITLTPLA